MLLYAIRLPFGDLQDYRTRSQLPCSRDQKFPDFDHNKHVGTGEDEPSAIPPRLIRLMAFSQPYGVRLAMLHQLPDGYLARDRPFGRSREKLHPESLGAIGALDKKLRPSRTSSERMTARRK